MIKTIVIIILGLGFVAVVIFLDVPGVESVLAKRKEIENQKQALIDKQDLLARVEKLTKLYEENKDNVEKTNFILPSSEEIPNLLVQLEALAFEQGLVLEKVDLSTAKKEEPTQGIEGQQQRVIQDYETMIINIGLTGTYEGLKSFLKATEENIRLMDVDSIGFDSAAETEEYEGPQMFNFNIVINAYYQ
jgi:Tfp pilus assembly protein PilO